MGFEQIKLCDYCENNSEHGSCAECPNRNMEPGRELCIKQMLETKGFKQAAKLRNIVRASEIVLFKDMCRVMGVLPAIANKITTNDLGKSCLEDHLDGEAFLKKISTFLSSQEVDTLVNKGVIDNLDYVYKCSDMVYGSSIHASGTLFSETDIALPIDAATGDCHCDGHYAEALGYIKYDLLSLAALVPINEILGINIDWNEASADRSLIEGMQDEDLTFTFQFGSSVVDNMIRGVDKKALDTISLSEITSINRPGPLNIHLNTTWVDRKNGNVPMKAEIDAFIKRVIDSGDLKLDIERAKDSILDAPYNEDLVDLLFVTKDEDPSEDIGDEIYKEFRDLVIEKIIGLVLEKKYGIPDKLLIFQEDIMALCSYGAGFTLGESDDIRRAMGKKKAELMASFEGKFIEGWTNIVGIFAKDVWLKMVDYAKYCFNKSHAVAYTLVTLKTAALQKYNFEKYMGWNYLNLNNDMKAKAAILLESKAHKSYPTFKKPYEGIKFGKDIEFKNIVLEEGCEDYQTEYEYLSDLFMTSDVKYKPKFLLRGLFDPWTKDMLGLVQLKKKLGKKADAGVGVIPSCNSFSKFLEMLAMKKYIKYTECLEYWQVTTKVKQEAKPEDWLTIYKNLEYMPQLNRNYRVKSLIKEFGVPKDTDFSEFSLDTLDQLEDTLTRYRDVFDRFQRSNPDKPIKDKKVFAFIMDKTKQLSSRIDALENRYGELVACVRDIDIKKDGSCKVLLQFANTTRVFYVKYDDYLKKNWHKNDIVRAYVSFYKYQKRDGYPNVILNLKAIPLDNE